MNGAAESEPTERAAFEEAAAAIGISDMWLEQDDAGKYTFARTMDLWLGWQLRAKLTTIEAAPVLETGPFAYWVYVPDEQRGEFVHDLDDAIDDLTNCECKVTPLYEAAPAGSAPLVLPEDDPVRAGFERWAFSVGWRNFTRDEHSGAYVVEGGLEHRWIGWRACHAYPLHATPMSPKQESR